MNGKKIAWVVLFVAIVVALIIVVVTSTHKENATNVATTRFNTTSESQELNSNEEEQNTQEFKGFSIYQKTELADGILYSVDGTQQTADVILKDKFFDTTIRDMNINAADYLGKKIQIDGLYFYNGYFSFVGRYSTSSLCPSCPAGYSFMEYHLKENIDKKLTHEQDWIKVIGTFTAGNDNGEEYYYLDVDSIEIMNEKGNDTVVD